jgi:hypothetical protein
LPLEKPVFRFCHEWFDLAVISGRILLALQQITIALRYPPLLFCASGEVTHTSLRVRRLKFGSSSQEADMAPEPGLALSLGIIFAMAVIVLAITTRIMRALPPRRSRRAK